MKKIILSLCILSSLGFTGCLGKSEVEEMKGISPELKGDQRPANVLNREW